LGKIIRKMFESEDIYENIKGVINSIPDNFKILEESIDIEVQKEFFESTKNISLDPEMDILNEMISKLNQGNTSIDDCKTLLQKIALIDSVEAFRAIETYTINPRQELKEWSVLALQQSRMVLQCSLLDEQQVFISTGLGGKKDKLRYYLIFPYNLTIHKINKIQKEALQKELDFFLSKHNGETEYTEFEKRYATAMTLIPLKAPIPDIIREVLNECNQFGDFLSPDVMITNMKKLSPDEILKIIDRFDE
jgi:hypothetical protein